MCLSLPFLISNKPKNKDGDDYTYRQPQEQQKAQGPSLGKIADRQPPPYPTYTAHPQQAYNPWQGPPGYVSPEAGRWKGPLGERKYENDVNRYGIVEADYRVRRRRRAGAGSAAAAGGGC